MVERFVVSVDVACFALDGAVLKLLLVQRKNEPFAGYWALPGGVVRQREPLDAAAQRILSQRTGMSVSYLEQLYTFGAPERDPRNRTISVAYYALLPGGQREAQSGEFVDAVAWHRVDALPPLAFDHAGIASYAQQRLAQKIIYAPIAFRLLPETFTLADLRIVHEAVEGRTYPHLSNFQTLMRSRWDLTRVPGAFDRRSKRPAQMYRYAGPSEISGPPEATPTGEPDAEEAQP